MRRGTVLKWLRAPKAGREPRRSGILRKHNSIGSRNGAHSARSNEPQNIGDHVDLKDNQIAHAQILPVPNPDNSRQHSCRFWTLVSTSVGVSNYQYLIVGAVPGRT